MFYKNLIPALIPIIRHPKNEKSSYTHDEIVLIVIPGIVAEDLGVGALKAFGQLSQILLTLGRQDLCHLRVYVRIRLPSADVPQVRRAQLAHCFVESI